MAGSQQAGALAHEVLSGFPPVEHAFAYGSAAFYQPGLYDGAAPSEAGGGPPTGDDRRARTQGLATDLASRPGAANGPMLDLMFIVRDPHEWHEQNMQQNPSHYRGVAALGPGAVAWCSDAIGAGVHFNSMVPFRGRMIKYGVARTGRVVTDLLTWHDLYVAGRLQKPVLFLGGDSDHDDAAQGHRSLLRKALAESRLRALAASLLTMPREFTERELLACAASLSYTGDVRMGIAEDPRKVERIVQGSYGQLRDAYHGAMSELYAWQLIRPRESDDETGRVRLWQPMDEPARARLVASLPPAILARLAAHCGVQVRPAQSLQTAPCAWMRSVLDDDQRRVRAGRSGGRDAAAGILDETLGLAWLGYGATEAISLGLAGRRDLPRLLKRAVRGVVRRSSFRQAAGGLLANGPAVALSYALSKAKKAFRGRLRGG
ncbi:unnamed protein product [Pedinophyceae sp. YPF-701]|nr:unnamed protein product [Pedinophyceae sp. YPF-701]